MFIPLGLFISLAHKFINEQIHFFVTKSVDEFGIQNFIIVIKLQNDARTMVFANPSHGRGGRERMETSQNAPFSPSLYS